MTFRFREMLAAATALATLALAAPVQAERVGNYHIMPTPEYKALTGRDGVAAAAGKMNYYGGSVFGNVKLLTVIWGSTVNPTTVSGIPAFGTALVNSTYMDAMKEYHTYRRAVDGRAGTKQLIKRGSYLGQVQITPANTGTDLQDADVQAELAHQISIGALPPQDGNTLYMVFFPLNVSITLDGIKSCRDFGAYHFAVNDTQPDANNLFYAVEPDCGYSFSTITYIAAHEFVEAITDNIPTPGSNPAFPQAWNDSAGYEVADKCSGSGTLVAGSKSWTVTQFYSNKKGGCTTGNYTSP